MRGRFFVIDGADGSGKATQAELLIARMRDDGFLIQGFAFPRYDTPTGKRVKQYLNGEFGPPLSLDAYEASMFYADDRKAAASEIENCLASGINVLADRYVAANMGHQGGKIDDPEDRLAFFRWAEDLEYGQNGIPRPDLNIILHMPAETSISLIDRRGNDKDGHESSPEHLKRAEETYLQIARSLPGFALIECVENGRLLSIPEVHERLWAIVRPILENGGRTSVRQNNTD